MIKEIPFETAKTFWETNHWPGTTVAAVSTIDFHDHDDATLLSAEAVYLGYYKGETLSGVVSGYISNAKLYYVRGLSGTGVHELLPAIEDKAVLARCDIIWSRPRRNGLAPFLKAGYAKVREVTTAEESAIQVVVMKHLLRG